MPSYSMELYDINGDNSSDITKGAKPSKQPGCYVSSLMGFVLVLLAVLVALGVGLIVFFAQSRDVTCSFDNGVGSGPPSISDAITSCKEWIEDGGSASSEICELMAVQLFS